MSRQIIHVQRTLSGDGYYATEPDYDGQGRVGWARTPLEAAQDLMYDLGLDPYTDPFVMRLVRS